MFICVTCLDIFQSSNLVDIPWSLPKSGRTNMVSIEQFYKFEYCTSDI